MNTNQSGGHATDTRLPFYVGVRLADDQAKGLALLAKEHGIKTAQMARVLITLAVHDMERARAAEAAQRA